jgi:hypothetical protein
MSALRDIPKSQDKFFIPNFQLCWTDRFIKGGAALANSHTYLDLPNLVLLEATGVCLPIGNMEVLLKLSMSHLK